MLRRFTRNGPLLMLLATLLFTLMVSLVKVARRDLTALEVICWRALTSVPLAFVVARRGGLAIGKRGVLLLRIVTGFAAMFCFFTAMKGLTVVEMTLVHKLQPILLALLAPLVLGALERSGRGVWLALVAGLVGTAVLVWPSADGELFGGGSGAATSFMLWGLGGAAMSALAHLFVRSLGQAENPDAVVFWFQVAALGLALSALLLTRGEVPLPPLALLPHLLGIGVLATLGQVAMTRAYSVEKASVVAAASYASPLWGLAGDVLVFGEWPTGRAIAGGALIVGGGLLLVAHQARKPQPTLGRVDSEIEHGTRVAE